MGTPPESLADLHRRDVLRGASVALTGALAGCDDQRPPQQRQTDDTELAVGQAFVPVSLDPVHATDVASRQIQDRLFQGLYVYTPDLELRPALADGPPTVSADGTRYIVDLDPDARFHSGDPVTARDVAYSYRAPFREDADAAWRLSMIDEVVPAGDDTVQFDLAHPYPSFHEALTWHVVSRDARESDPDAFATEQPVGSGPFEFGDWVQGDYALLRRWDDYWAEPTPAVERVQFLPIPNATERVATLKTGKTDAVARVPPELWQTLTSLSDTEMAHTPGLNYYYLGFNCAAGPCSSHVVREAVDYAVSFDTVVSDLIGEAGERQYAPFPDHVVDEWDFPVEEWAAVPHEKNVERARTMLDSAEAVPEDWQPRLLLPRDRFRRNLADRLVDALEEVGYPPKVVEREWPAFRREHVTGDPADYDMFLGGWLGRTDPDTYLYPQFSEWGQGRTGGTHFTGASQDVEVARTLRDRERRRERYVSAVDAVLGARAQLPLYTDAHNFGLRSRVSDFRTHPVYTFTVATPWNNVRITEK